MPHVFDNRYTFTAGAVPVAEAFADRISRRFGLQFELEKQERGFKGAPRTYACLRSPGMQVWVYWEENGAEVELMVDEPMERMIEINAAVMELGGRPRYPDEYWRSRRRYQTKRTIKHIIVSAFVVFLMGLTIWELHWWGALIVVTLIALGVGTFVFALGKAFTGP